jgi:hypothetical protein
MQDERERKFLQEALDIIKKGEEKGIIFRLMGATAVKMHCPKFAHMYAGMARSLTDLDFMTYGKFNVGMKKFFIELGYTPNESVIRYYGKYRHIYWNEEKQWQADIFFDVLNMCHVVEFKGRLELDNPTITLTDILLEKMQIVKINMKDIKDSIIMLREHEVGHTEKECINLDYLSKILSDDWGYYYTVTTNLSKIKYHMSEVEGLTEIDKKDVNAKVDTIIRALKDAPKSMKWKMRERVGTKVKWYNEVEEVVR